MLISRELSGTAGIEAAQVAMATELNVEVLTGMGFTMPPDYSANDLLIAVRGAQEAALAAAVTAAEQLLSKPATGGSSSSEQRPPRTIGVAARTGTGFAIISVPGQHAFTEAMDALESDCDVMIFSDNVSLAQEIALKDAAAATGRLVMGPDCGTAVVGGIGLGFSHSLDVGPVGLVTASGTGAQQVLCLLDAAGIGVSAALGVGGRDLSTAVAGRSTLAAMTILDGDPGTELILVVSKPPADAIAEQVREHARALRTPVRFALLGQGETDLTAATERALDALGVTAPSWPSWISDRPPRPGLFRGLFCGGTLCDEAMLIATGVLGEIRSNIPLRPDWTMDVSPHDPARSHAGGHWMIDFGDDALTQGRAHPMIDPSLRTEHLKAALEDASTGVVLLDVVLGHGAHPDPAAELLPLIARTEIPFVISLIGARQDPQDLHGTAERLHAAGASVFTSNAAATRHALGVLGQAGQQR
jgi:FdrA protein